jgi:hypothetical protein
LRFTFALRTLPLVTVLGAVPEPAGAPGAAEPPVWALALAAPMSAPSAKSAASARLIPADASRRKPTSFSGLRG